ncbi:hypothetical protein PEBR_02006 [Penicillium brasilianum]|uniref:Uncharacterized protein n=1 Tax=Penicillium brasilianum TaxID=104259 RepID=A0A1S9RZL4_PENBI|nr:hypothetical protein PEBR_02006 [Penicillium brasilianum]
METTLSTFPADDMDLMSPFYPTLSNIDQADTKNNLSLFAFEDIESAAIFKAFCSDTRQEPGLDTGLHHNSNIAEEPATVAPLETLLAFDHSSSDGNTCSPVTTDTTLKKKQSAAILIPPTPIDNSPIIQSAVIAPSAPASVDVNKPNQHREPRAPSTPVLIDMVARQLHEEWIDLNHSSSTTLPDPAPTTMNYHPVEYPLQFQMCHPMHYLGHRPIPCPMEFGQICPHLMFYPHMGRPLPLTYPVPSPAPRQSPVSNKRTFDFVEPEIPENFVANPDNHGRWQYDRNGNRHYLNAPKTKITRTT